jgi:hypothetical protein
VEFTRVTEHFEENGNQRWSSDEAVTHIVEEEFTTNCGTPVGNYQSGWIWGEYVDSNYCKDCFQGE